MPNLSTITRPASGPMVIDLRGHQGNFESAAIPSKSGHRTFGLWSMSQVRVGDLVIKPITGSAGLKGLYKVTETKVDFQGREGDDYYVGVMVDVIDSYRRTGIDLLTPEDMAALPK